MVALGYKVFFRCFIVYIAVSISFLSRVLWLGWIPSIIPYWDVVESFPLAVLVAGCGRRMISPSGIVAMSVRAPLSISALVCGSRRRTPIVLGVDPVIFSSDAILIAAAWSLGPGE